MKTDHAESEQSSPVKPRRSHLRQVILHGSVTFWNLLALLVLLVGGVATLGAGQLWLRHWAQSGIHVPVGGTHNVPLPHGTTVVFYESAVSVPERDPSLKIRDAYGIWVNVRRITDSNNYRLMLSGWSGRAIGEVTLDEAGTYAITCTPLDFLNMNEVPEGDRVTLLKEPGTLAEANAIYKTILIIGASITVPLTAALYILHFVALQRKARRNAAVSNA